MLIYVRIHVLMHKKLAEVVYSPPKVHAVYTLAAVRGFGCYACSRRTYPAHDGHDPPAGIIVEYHVAFFE
jgi:hypothetical protein